MSIDLARRAVACKGWRWMRGMSAWWRPDADETHPMEHGPYVTVLALRDDGSLDAYVGGAKNRIATEGLLPDLDDPATLGCLLALVREAWGEPDAYATPRYQTAPFEVATEWSVFASPLLCFGPTEAAALVAALEAAP